MMEADKNYRLLGFLIEEPGCCDRGKEMSLSRCIGLYYKLPKSDPYAVY